MYQYKISDDISSSADEVIKKKNKSAEDFVNDLKQINSTLSTGDKVSLPDTPDFTRMEDVVIDDTKIKEDATKELQGYRESKIENINTEFENKSKELESNKKSLYSTTGDMTDSIRESYNVARENANADAIKRGLASSSIVINTLDAFNKDELKAYREINKELTDGINAINFELNALVSSKDTALKNFDIEYASELNARIKETTERLKEAQEKVIKYNNEIAEKEADFLKSISELENKINDSNWEREKDVAELIAEYGATTVDRVRNNQLLSTAKSYFAGLSKKEAAEIVTNYPEIVSLLGENNYKEILKMYE